MWSAHWMSSAQEPVAVQDRVHRPRLESFLVQPISLPWTLTFTCSSSCEIFAKKTKGHNRCIVWWHKYNHTSNLDEGQILCVLCKLFNLDTDQTVMFDLCRASIPHATISTLFSASAKLLQRPILVQIFPLLCHVSYTIFKMRPASIATVKNRVDSMHSW